MSERTLILVKPDGVERGLIGQILSRFESKGYTIEKLKMLQPSTTQSMKVSLSTSPSWILWFLAPWLLLFFRESASLRGCAPCSVPQTRP